MKFPYHKVSLPEPSKYFGKSILKPILPVMIVTNSRELRYAALIDSGADFCIFDAQIGEYLGLDVRAGDKEIFGGIEGGNAAAAVAFLHRVTINVGGFDYPTTVGFSYDIATHGYGILGQKGFFEIFVVKFDFFREEIELKIDLRNKP